MEAELKTGADQTGFMAEASAKPPRFEKLKSQVRKGVQKLSRQVAIGIESYMIGPMEKGIAAAKLQTPPKHVLGDVDLSVLPKFICYRAALLREKLALQSILWCLAGVFLVSFIFNRWEISHLYDRLRQKEYILAPGVQDFIPVAPQSVPESHVVNTANAFVQAFGNITPTNIDEQYKRLADSMSDELRVRFEIESAHWKEQVKTESISETLSVTQREFIPSGDGHYRFTFHGKKDSFANNEHLGSKNIVINMVLKLVSPKAKQWYLEIEELSSHDASTYESKTSENAPVRQTSGSNGGVGK